MITILKNIRDLVRDTLYKALEIDIFTQGAAIAFYTIFSVAPLFIVIISVAGFFVREETINEQIRDHLHELVGPDISGNLTEFIFSSLPTLSGIITTIIAGVVIIFGATAVINQLKLVLNKIWNIQTVNIHSAWNFLLDRLLSFAMIIIISLLLIFSLLTEAVIGLTSGFIQNLIPSLSLDFYRVLSQITTVGFSVLFFTLIFKILPDVHARWIDLLTGAVVTTLLFLLGKYLIGYYLSASGIQTTYKAAGTLTIFVIWVYYNALTVLLGAVFTQVYTTKFGGNIRPYKYIELKQRP